MTHIAKRFVLLSSILIASVATVYLISFNYLVLHEVEKITDEGRWLEEKISKGRLLLRRSMPPRVVFIGSSRTQNHIATEIFAQVGIDIFNYGLAGRFWADYSYMIDRAIEKGTRNIVMILPPRILMNDPDCPQSPTPSDLKGQIAIGSLEMIRCISPDKLIKMLPGIRYSKFLETTNPLLREVRLLELAERFQYELNGEDINAIRGKHNRFVVTYPSGDGIVYGNREISSKMQEVKVGPARDSALRYLAHLNSKVKRAGIKFIMVLGPVGYNRHFEFTENALPTESGYPIIDASDQRYGPEFWADARHFNIDGRERFNRWLIERLKPILE